MARECELKCGFTVSTLSYEVDHHLMVEHMLAHIAKVLGGAVLAQDGRESVGMASPPEAPEAGDTGAPTPQKSPVRSSSEIPPRGGAAGNRETPRKGG